VVLIAASASNKGQEDFLRAASIIRESMSMAQFAIIGGGDERYLKELKDLALQLGLESDLFFVDFMEDIAPVYGSLDVLVCASLKETFGRTIVEAMLAEKPVVSTRCGGPEEIVIDGVTGFLVPVKAPQELARAVLRILGDRDLAQQMGQAGKNRALSGYSMQSYARQIQDIIEECVSEHMRKKPLW
jgi:glycosyltransferase involved in cell wall biosynthesis